jgi:hypothetical protein
MEPEKAITAMYDHLQRLYEDVRFIGTGRAKFVRTGKGRGRRCATISVAEDETSWFVELWSANDLTAGAETCIEEKVIQTGEEALEGIRAWLEGG